jgi:hypothetical protein
MSKNWKDLTSIELKYCMKDDSHDLTFNFQPLRISGHRFQKLHFASQSRQSPTMNGICQLLENSPLSLDQFKLVARMTSNDVLGLVVKYHQLESLSLTLHDNDEVVLFTHQMMKTIAKNLSLLKRIEINIRLNPASDVSNTSISALVHGFPMLHIIRFLWYVCDHDVHPTIPQRITRASYVLIAENLNKTIR